MTVRVCPERDGRCPHGLDCAFAIDRFSCDMDGSRAAMQARPRVGDWMETFTGRQFWPLDPDIAAIDIRDIAHALSNACRYAGHVQRFYSVAEHCVLLARYVPEVDRLWGLLHDASEAYLVDIPRPVKPYLDNYGSIELNLMAAVCTRFGMRPDMPDSVKDADNRILRDERAQAMHPSALNEWNLKGPPLGVTLRFWSPAAAEHEFLSLFAELTGGLG